jgi:hypothetical protein
MPRIDRTCLETIKSPIRFLMKKNLGDSVFRIAPEREAEFATVLTNFDLIYLNERPWVLYAKPKTREVFVSRGAVELAWCASLAHLLFYERFIQGKRLDQPTQIDPQSDPLVRNALELLGWSLHCQLTGDNSDDWPQDLPRPLETSTPGSYEEFADELCLVCCAFLLHHELAHIRAGHPPSDKGDWSISQEKEADILAAEWILDRVDAADFKFVKRMLGIVQANLLTTAYGLYGGNLGGNTHPFSYDRLTSLLNRFLGYSDHDTKAFAFAILALHFKNSKRQLIKTKFNDFGEALEAICDQMAEEQGKMNPRVERRI